MEILLIDGGIFIQLEVSTGSNIHYISRTFDLGVHINVRNDSIPEQRLILFIVRMLSVIVKDQTVSFHQERGTNGGEPLSHGSCGFVRSCKVSEYLLCQAHKELSLWACFCVLFIGKNMKTWSFLGIK